MLFFWHPPGERRSVRGRLHHLSMTHCVALRSGTDSYEYVEFSPTHRPFPFGGRETEATKRRRDRSDAITA